MTAPFDQQKSDAFGDKIAETVNHAGVALMTSIGRRTGLFDQMARMDWVDSSGLAARARLSERYVREWLGAMATRPVNSSPTPALKRRTSRR